MKRYRIVCFDLDGTWGALQVARETGPQGVLLEQNILRALQAQFGIIDFDQKLQNYQDLGRKPFSIVAFHNRFLDQCRTAFVVGAYYPALVGACALGERILNHLLLLLREDFGSTPAYTTVAKQKSFNNWTLAIDTLHQWEVLLDDAVISFGALEQARHRAIHFNPATDTNDRELALTALNLLEEIVSNQFSAFGTQPWFIGNTPGASYIKKTWESKPFVRRVYLPNCLLVGPRHQIRSYFPAQVADEQYSHEEITDLDFVELRKAFETSLPH